MRLAARGAAPGDDVDRFEAIDRDILGQFDDFDRWSEERWDRAR
jgi:hypothetical protein